MKKYLVGAVACLAATALAGAANAAEVTYTFQNPKADLPTGNYDLGSAVGKKCNGISVSGGDLCVTDEAAGLTYVDAVSGLSVTATGYYRPNPLLPDTVVTSLLQDLQPADSGLAVISPFDKSGRDDQIQKSSHESLIFEFSKTVHFLNIDLNAGNDNPCSKPNSKEGPCGSFDIIVDGTMTYTFNDTGSTTSGDNIDLGGLTGKVFEIIPTDDAVPSGFAIGSITVSEMPVPGAAVLLLSGLAGFGLTSRRRKAA
ncbi:MAG: VPLPA-CTERM sorting domain-containing protein [Pseudomonadota bacterium]